MRSVYADTVRWRPEVDPAPVNQASSPLSTAMPEYVACEPRLLLSEMASTVAREAIRRHPGVGNPTLDQVIVCATSFEDDLALSCAGRLHSELGSTGVPFAIGQLQGASSFLALQVVSDMMASDERMRSALIVGAERWLPPFPRQVGTLTALGDGAAAALVRRRAGPGWRVLNVNVRTPCLPFAPPDMGVDATIAVEVIRQTCVQAGLQPGEIDWIVPPRINTTLACDVAAQARLPVWRIWYPEPRDIGYLCAADALAQLHLLLQSVVVANGQRILLWATGFQGQAACAILQYCGS
ncbi:3-oxoacyl-[acyl-carrier-protein] synthase III C-terminal domain-containing protein [Paraburkholderia strydomiana]|uniref:3-oxoacyl-[acyl-carrier-protein] synthase III C-terminal domain-containing protein n=1 Tax=Paraburkholderia strydomiana TaxID=1245417 RepID=UPI0038B9FCE8